MRIILTIAITILLIGCYTLESEGPYRVPKKSTITLHKNLSFKVDQVAIYFQKGKIVPANSIQNYTAFCFIELKKQPKKIVKIKPTRFEVRKSKYQYDARVRYQILASASTIISGIDRSHVEYETELFLHSKSQPKVNKLTCKHWVDPLDARFVRLTEMRAALGAYFDIKVYKFKN